MASRNTLQNAIAKARATKNTTSNSEKNPAWYNRQKGRFITGMVTNESADVRAIALGDVNCPTTYLKAAIENETDAKVVRAIFMNPNTPEKTILENLANPALAEMDDDKELTAHLVGRIEKK